MRSLLPACFFIAMACGTLYIYSAFAPQLSDRLGLSATQTSSIGIAGNLSMSLSGPFAGMLVDRFGFLWPVLISAVCNLVGYTLIRTLYVNAIASAWLLTLALVLVGISSTFAFSSSVKCAAINHPRERGFATSVVMAGYGLSAFVLSTIASRAGGSNPTETMLSVLSFVPTALIVLFGPTIVSSERGHKKHEKVDSDSDFEGDETVDGPIQLVPMRSRSTAADNIVSAAAKQEPLNWRQLPSLQSFWCYCIILGCLAGMGQTYIYSCGYMVKALATYEDEKKWQARQVAVLSVANFGGRMISGVASDWIKNSLRQRRDWVLSMSISACLVAQLGARFATSLKMLDVLSICNGLFYGLCFGAFPGIISEAYGIEHFSSNWGVIALSPIGVSYFLTRRLGRLYDTKATPQGVCLGPQCFKSAYTLTSILSVALFAVLLWLLRIKELRK